VHTTGVDVHQAATAAQTLGKDMTWRDYTQGAWRMRQVGKGQRIDVLVTPEVARLVAAAAAAGEGTQPAARAAALAAAPPAASAWLVRTSPPGSSPRACAPRATSTACCASSVRGTCGASAPSESWLRRTRQIGATSAAAATRKRLGQCVDAFRERVDYMVENAIPAGRRLQGAHRGRHDGARGAAGRRAIRHSGTQRHLG
jgi:hypothetical protein